MRAHLAICSHGYLGLITSDAKVATPYSGDYQDTSWTGIHLTEHNGKKIGDRWQSKAPRILCHLRDMNAGHTIGMFTENAGWGKFPGDFNAIRSWGKGVDGMNVRTDDGSRYEWTEAGGWNQTAGCGVMTEPQLVEETLNRR